jgi:hypothetical protein
MFVQVITGKVVDEASVREQDARWQRDLRPGAAGYLGSTWGTTIDRRFVATIRFDTPESARRASDRPEQIACHDDGDGYTDIVYFTSEAEARAGEQKPATGDAKDLLDQVMSAITVDEYFDLANPTLQ